MRRYSMLQQWQTLWQDLLRDKGAIMVLLIAPVLYAFFYPQPYKTEQIHNLPLVVLDEDRSAQSRQLIRLLDSRPEIDVVAVTVQRQPPQVLLDTHQAMGWLRIPAGLGEDLMRGVPAQLEVGGHGGWLLASGRIMAAVNETGLAIGTLSREQRLINGGLHPEISQQLRQPLAVDLMPHFNPAEGYGSYLVPAVLVMIAQQSLWVGLALIAGRQQAGPSEQRWLQRFPLAAWSLFSVLSTLQLLFAFGFMHWYLGFPFRGQWQLVLLLSVFFAGTCSAVGLLLSRCWQQREQGMQWLLPTAIPFFFVSGYAVPVEALPEAVRWLRWLLPSTAGIDGFTRLVQMGAQWHELLRPFAALLLQGLVAGTLLAWISRQDPERTTRSSAAKAASRWVAAP